jgi:pantothenate kinase
MPKLISAYNQLLQHVVDDLGNAKPPYIIAIAGPPATGKSTLAERLVDDLTIAGTETCFCPMDGFHLSNEKLKEQGLESVKGRIDTFDGQGFLSAMRRLKNRTAFWWPIYSRERHDPIPEGVYISGTEMAYVVEGNYLLSAQEPWQSTSQAFDLRVFVDAPDAILRQRLLARHQLSGRSALQAQQKISSTDMPNARIIRNEGLQRHDLLFCEAS